MVSWLSQKLKESERKISINSQKVVVTFTVSSYLCFSFVCDGKSRLEYCFDSAERSPSPFPRPPFAVSHVGLAAVVIVPLSNQKKMLIQEAKMQRYMYEAKWRRWLVGTSYMLRFDRWTVWQIFLPTPCSCVCMMHWILTSILFQGSFQESSITTTMTTSLIRSVLSDL